MEERAEQRIAEKVSQLRNEIIAMRRQIYRYQIPCEKASQNIVDLKILEKDIVRHHGWDASPQF